MHAHYTLSNSANQSEETPNPIRIDIEPKDITIETYSRAIFKAIAYDNRGNIIKDAQFTWKVDNPSLGKVFEDGELISGRVQMIGKVFACYKDVCGYADVKVIIQPAIIKVSKAVIDFSEVEWGKNKYISIYVTNDSWTPTFINVSNPGTDFWFAANVKTDKPIKKGDKFCYIRVDLNFKKLERRCEKQNSFDIHWFYVDDAGNKLGEGKITIPVKVKVYPPKCASTAPTMLNYGKVSRGQTKTMGFTVVFTNQRNVKGFFELGVPWLSITPKEFTTKYENLPADQVKLTLDTKKLPKGKLHTTYVTVKSETCEDVKLDVRVETEEKVTSKISIGSKEGTVNGNKVVFADPPIIKNNGTYLTPEIFEKIFFAQTKIEGNKLEIIWQSKKILGKIIKIGGVQYADLSIRKFADVIGANTSYTANDKSITIVWTPE
jgi:hypothetical protein